MLLLKSKKILIFSFAALLAFGAILASCHREDTLDADIQQLIDKYLAAHKKDELLTAVSVSISLSPKEKIRNYVAGRLSNEVDAPLINDNNLFQIGSITQSFTASIILQLEAEGKLNINQTIGNWFPQYPRWKKITIKNLLNMTSGIPDYLHMPKILKQIASNTDRKLANHEIVNMVYASHKRTTGFQYSNTNYILLAMIIEKVTSHPYGEELKKRLLSKYGLTHIYYSDTDYKSIATKMVQGYFYGSSFPNLHGKNVTNTNWLIAGPSGGIIGTPEDVLRWLRALFTGALFPQKQLDELKEVISINSGKTIPEVAPKEPKGFGLGVLERYAPHTGPYWFYKGETFGYRVLYIWQPCNYLSVAVALNSAALTAPEAPDKSGELLKSIYSKILELHPEYVCKE